MPFKGDDGSGQDDIAVAVAIDGEAAVLLQLLAQSGSHRLDQARFDGFVFEGKDLNGASMGPQAVGGAKPVSTPARRKDEGGDEEPAKETAPATTAQRPRRAAIFFADVC